MLIIFAGGGTLGSVTPLLAVAKEIGHRNPDVEFLWLGTEGGPEEGQVRQAGLRFMAISSGKLRRYLSLRNFSDVFRIALGYFQAKKILKTECPAVVVSAGGFVAVPVVWAAGRLGIPVHIHQMDIRPGLANRLSAPFAKSFSVAYSKSLSDFAKNNPAWTGNPVRDELFGRGREEAAEFFGLDGNLPTVVVLGGGTGAVSLNRIVAEAAPMLSGKANVIHVTGKGKSVDLPEGTKNFRQFESFGPEEMALAYAAADLVLTRAGMGTLTELASLGKPAVIVPIPNSHQEENAALFEESGAAEVWPEPDLSSEKLSVGITSLLSDSVRLHALGKKIMEMNRSDASVRLADMVLRFLA